MEEIISVQVGKVKAAAGDGILKANALGSCIAVAAFDPVENIGAMAHVMLPGKAPEKKDNIEKTKYAVNAIETILEKMIAMGSNTDNIKAALVGGGNVLHRDDDSICRDNIESVTRFIKEKKINVVSKVLGGFERKSAILDVQRGTISYTEGNSGEKQLWKAS